MSRRDRGLHGSKRQIDQAPVNVGCSTAGGKASASSEYPDAAIHKIAHLNDGRVGNGRSWISRVAGEGECHDRLARARDDRPRGLGSRSRGKSIATAWRPSITSRRLSSRADGRLSPRRSIASAYDPDRLAAQSAARRRPVSRREIVRERAELTARQAQLRAQLSQLGADAQGLCRHVQPARADAPAGARRSDEEGAGGQAVDDRRDQAHLWCLIPGRPSQAAAQRWRGGSPIRPIRCRRE